MTAVETASPLAQRQAEFRRQLVDRQLLAPLGDGIYGRSGAFEAVVDGLERLITEAGSDQDSTVLRFPPVFPRAVFERTDYLKSFPDLVGAVFSFDGDDRRHARLLARQAAGEDWVRDLDPTETALVSAACHPAYPTLTGTLPAGGRRLDVLTYCFRREPSLDPARMQSFRQREYVYVGEPATALAHRDLWIERGQTLLSGLGLAVRPTVANDPFFGRAGRLLAAGQREANLKIELVVQLYGQDEPGTAIVSSNYHLDHFGAAFGIETAAGEPAHSACVGFGLERVTLALLRTHGLDIDAWPQDVRTALWP